MHEPPQRDGERHPLVTAVGGLEVVLLPHGAAAVVVRVDVWEKEERGRWSFKGGRAWDTMPLKAAQKPSRRPSMRVQNRQPRH
jgi:hypothetical protein